MFQSNENLTLKIGDRVMDTDINNHMILIIIDISDNFLYVENNFTPLTRYTKEEAALYLKLLR